MAFMQRSVDQDGAGLTVTQQAVRVRKIRRKGMFPVSLLNWASIATDLAGLRELGAVRQLEFDFRHSS